jgi:hypothetical protein
LDATTVTVAHVRKPCGAVEVLTAPFLENVLSCNFRDSDFFDKEEAYLWMCEARDVVPIPFEMMLSRRVLATLPHLAKKGELRLPPKGAEAGNFEDDRHPLDASEDIMHHILHRSEEKTVHAAKLIKEKVCWRTEEKDFNDIVVTMMANVEFCMEEHCLWDIFNVNKNARKCLVHVIISVTKPAKFSKNMLDKV